MKSFCLKSFLCLLFVAVAFAGYGEASQSDVDSVIKRYEVFHKNGSTKRISYLNACKELYSLYEKDPSSVYAAEALHSITVIYGASYGRYGIEDDLKNQLKYFRLVGVMDNKYSPGAYLQAANIYSDLLKDHSSAIFMLNKLEEKYPSSPEAVQGRAKYAAISGKFDKKPYVPSKPVNIQSRTAFTDKELESISGGRPVIKNIRYYSSDVKTRIVIDLTGEVSFQKHWLKEDPSIGKPPRLYVDINGSGVASDIPASIELNNEFISNVRWAYNKPWVPRIVLDTENVTEFDVFALPEPYRIVIDVRSDEPHTLKTPDITVDVRDSDGNVPLTEVFRLGVRTLVLDPGHGGKDPGAVAHGIKEKDLVLSVSKYVKELFDRDGEINTRLTRDEDVFIPLEERPAIANALQADIFMSVHGNASENSGLKGIMTFVLNVTNDQTALEVAALENQSTTKAISELQGILESIIKGNNLEQSLKVAGVVQENMLKARNYDKTYDKGVRQAPFYVLVGADMPAVLVEVGFITNAEEANKMKSESDKKAIAEGIYKGLKEYIDLVNKDKEFSGSARDYSSAR